MNWQPRVLLVAPTPRIAAGVFAWLTDYGCDVTVVSAFVPAKAYLDGNPSIIISEVRLGEYNGLHLALRARSRNIPAVVIGQADPVLAQEAQQLGATFVPTEIDRDRLVAAVAPILARAKPAPTARPAGNLAFVSGRELGDSAASMVELAWTGGRAVIPS